MKLSVILWCFVLGVWSQSSLLSEQTAEKGALKVVYDDGHISDNTCWDSLSCTFADIESMSMENRLQFVKYMGSKKLPQLASADEFHAVEGVIGFFIRRHVAPQGSWMSTVNAAVIEAFERGAAVSLGFSDETGGNPAAEKWRDFFDRRKSGRLTDRTGHDAVWGKAEQIAVEYGIRLADSNPDIEPPSSREIRWEKFTTVYRTIMQYRKTILWIVKLAFSFTDPAVSMAFETFINWFTDVTDETSTGFLADLAWKISALGLSKDGEDPAADLEVIMQVVTECWEAMQEKGHTE